MKTDKKQTSVSTNIKRLPIGPITISDFYDTLKWVKEYVDGKEGKSYTFERPLFCSTDNLVSLKYNSETGKLVLDQGLLSVDYTNAVDNTNKLVESQAVYNAIALLQPKTDNALETTSKTVVGAINEINAKTNKCYQHSCGIRNIVNTEYIVFEIFTNDQSAPTMSQLMLHKQLNWNLGVQASYIDSSGNINACRVKANNATKFIILMNNVPIEWNINECNYEFHDVVNLLDVSEI